MAGLKAKISTAVDKLTHHKAEKETGGTGSGYTEPNYSTTGTTGTGLTGTGTPSTGAGMGGTTGTSSSYGTTSTGQHGNTAELSNVSGGQQPYGQTTTSGYGGSTGYETGTTGTGTTGYGGTTTTQTTGAQIIDSKTFTKTEDHEILVEKKIYEKEHRPIQQQYVVETRLVGESAVQGRPTEVVGTETKEIDERIKPAPAGDRTVIVENVDVDVPGATTSSYGTTGTTGTTGYGTGTGTSGYGTGTGTGNTGYGGTGNTGTY